MDGRVKTLHPKVHGGILARRHRPDDRAALAAHGITPIDLVVVNLYPFASAAARPDLAVRRSRSRKSTSAARVSCGRPRRTSATCSWSSNPRTTRACSRRCARTAARRRRSGSIWRAAPLRTRPPTTTMIATTLESVRVDEVQGRLSARCHPVASDLLPGRLAAAADEDPRSALRREPASDGRLVRGGRPRLRRRDRASGQGTVVHEPARSGCGRAHRARVRRAGAVVIKHTNPCGVATGATLAEAYRPGARRRSAVRLRRHRGPQPPARRETRPGR